MTTETAADVSVPPPAEDDGRPESVEDAIACVLRSGPKPGFEIARGLATDPALAVDGREGSLYAVLLQMRRAGRISGAWRPHPRGRRFLYGLPGSLAADGAGTDESLRADGQTSGSGGISNGRDHGGSLPDDVGVMVDVVGEVGDGATHRPAQRVVLSRVVLNEASRQAVDRCVEKLRFAPRLQEELRVQLRHHLEDALGPPKVTGGNPENLQASAAAALGDPWKVAVDLARAARGQTIVPFPRTAAEGLRSAWTYDAPILALIVFTIVFVRIEVVTAYHIPTKSMEPTLHGDKEDGDRILVLRWVPQPSRFQITVFDGWREDRKHFVKRCVGLPNEQVSFREGDLWIDGHLIRKEGSDLDALMFPLFDIDGEMRRAARPKADALADRLKDEWARDEGVRWAIAPADGTIDVWAGEKPAVLRWNRDPNDEQYDPQTCEIKDAGLVSVSDLRLTLDVTPADADTRLAMRLTRGPVTCDAVLCGDAPGVAFTVDGAEVARAKDVRIAPGTKHRVRFSRVDYVLRLDVDGAEVLRYDLPEPTDPQRNPYTASVETHLIRSGAKIRPVKLERDVHWTNEYGDVQEGRLGPDEFFMCGDNSSNSRDSRVNGPVQRGRLVGKPLLIVWPLSRFGVPR